MWARAVVSRNDFKFRGVWNTWRHRFPKQPFQVDHDVILQVENKKIQWNRKVQICVFSRKVDTVMCVIMANTKLQLRDTLLPGQHCTFWTIIEHTCTRCVWHSHPESVFWCSVEHYSERRLIFVSFLPQGLRLSDFLLSKSWRHQVTLAVS